ncbi:uncharacterized protein FIBRA_00660 [Fibroporia radiculosa]|uniref:Uncharacterized protein n=1 Tax=Fibroporia radiculosa TaxID=599839 RepID=J4G0J2_9APHY|nr:uncharacterized protein FIBRA_00660 [Fibroporia radiculosa]CCL98658.1 predicted protein [Fibroporia radiculosa]
MRVSAFALISLIAVVPAASAPIEAFIPIADSPLSEIGLVGPSEIPNLNLLNASPHGSILKHFGRQIRIADHNVGGNMTWPLAPSAGLLKRSKKSEAIDRARMKMQQQNAPLPSATPPPPQPQAELFAAPMGASTSALQGLGDARASGSDGFHQLLGTAFDSNSTPNDPVPNGTQTTTSAGVMPTFQKVAATAVSTPIDPRYTTSTTSTPHSPHAALRSRRGDLGRELTAHNSVAHPADSKGHSMVVNTNAILPEPSSADQGPKDAYEDVGLIDIDSNRPPPPQPLAAALPKSTAYMTGIPEKIEQNPANATTPV